MSLATRLLALAVVVAALVYAVLVLATGDAFALLALVVVGLLAAVAFGVILLFDVVVRAARQVLGRAAPK